MINERLLQQKKKMNRRRPKFLRQDYHHRIKVSDDYWRAPKGSQSKMREKRIGHRAVVKVGYGGPVELRGLHRTGAELVYISNLKQLDTINAKEQAVIVQGTLGLKKKYDILKKAAEKSISVIGINAKKFISDFEAFVKGKQEKKAAKKVVEVKTAEKKPEAKEKSPEKSQIKQPQTKEIPPKAEAKKI